jgi:hypothetical protein
MTTTTTTTTHQGVEVDEVDLEWQAVERGGAAAERMHVDDALLVVGRLADLGLLLDLERPLPRAALR